MNPSSAPRTKRSWGADLGTGPRGQEGVSLIIVLVIVTVLALIVGGLLSAAQQNFSSSAGAATIRNMTYAADGGIEYGIAQARAGNCHSPSTGSPPALTQLAPGESSSSALTLTEPSINPTVSVSCQTVSGNSLTNTYGGSEGNPGYSLVTNSPTGAGCVSLASDAVGQQPNQIKYAAATHCATYANASSPDLWTAVNGAPVVSPVPNLTSVYYLPQADPAPDVAWAVGNNTAILYFDGSAWSQQTCAACDTKINLTYVFATDAQDVWAVGNEGGTPVVLFSDGTSWIPLPVSSVIPTNTTLTSIWGAVAQGGVQSVWIVGANGANGVAYQLSEGGAGQCASGGTCTLAAESLPTGTKALTDLTGLPGASLYDLWAVGQGGTIVSSPDSGTTWVTETSGTTQPLNGVFALDTDHVWAVGNQSTLTSTSNASAGTPAGSGATWTAGSFGSGQQLNEIWGYNTGSGYDLWVAAQGDPGGGSTAGIYFYDGTSWSAENGPVPKPTLLGISGVGTGSQQVIVVGQNQTMWYFNGLPNSAGTPSNNGPPWTQQASGTNQQLNAVSGVPGTKDVWAVGNPQGPNETIQVTTDGTTWSSASVTVSKPQPLFGVSAGSASAVWAVGGQGQILYFNGSTWTPQTSGTTRQLNAVFALDSQHAWAVGNPQGSKYTVLYTTNGGATWSPATLPGAKAQPLFGVWAAPTGAVWVVGGQGQIFYCSGSCASSAATWTPQASGTTKQLNAVAGISASQVWVVGQNGPKPPGSKPGPGGPSGTETILSYQGGTWVSVGPSTAGAQPLQGVFAQSNASTGTANVYAVGGNGSIWFSPDGSDWNQEMGAATGAGGKRPPPGGNLRGVTAVGTGIGQAWAAGNGGAIWNFNPFAQTGMAIDSGGPVFNAGAVQASSVFWASDSGLVQGGTSTCPSNPGIVNLYVNGAYSCTATAQAAVTKNLPSSPSTLYGWSTPPATCTPTANHTYSAACQHNPKPAVTHPVAGCNLVQFTPGIYAKAPNISGAAANNTTFFFPSGIYYFDNVGNIIINGTSGGTNGTFVIGGTPANSDESNAIASQSPCWSYITAHDPGVTTGGANGVEFILGGNSAVQIQKGNIELFTRTGGNPNAAWGSGPWGPDGSQAVSIREACSPASSGLTTAVDCASIWDPTNIGGNGQILTYTGQAPPPPGGCPAGAGAPKPGPGCTGPEVDIHGSIYAPDDNLDLYSEANASNLPTKVGAVDVWSLEVGESSYSAPAVEIAGGGTYAERSIVFTAYASAGAGTTPVQEEAEVGIGSPGADPVINIQTWRSCLPVSTAGAACSDSAGPSTTTTTSPVAGLAGLGFPAAGSSITPSGNTFTCSGVSQSVTCTPNAGMGGTGSFSGQVALENSSGGPVTNTGGALTVNCSVTNNSGTSTVSPSSSTIATGASASSSAFTLTGGGKGWNATMTCSVVVAGTTYTIAFTGH